MGTQVKIGNWEPISTSRGGELGTRLHLPRWGTGNPSPPPEVGNWEPVSTFRGGELRIEITEVEGPLPVFSHLYIPGVKPWELHVHV